MAGAILHDRGSADNGELGDLSHIVQDLILDAVGEISVFFVFAEAFEREDRNALWRNVGSRRERVRLIRFTVVRRKEPDAGSDNSGGNN